jgi:hypothetical protein
MEHDWIGSESVIISGSGLWTQGLYKKMSTKAGRRYFYPSTRGPFFKQQVCELRFRNLKKLGRFFEQK